MARSLTQQRARTNIRNFAGGYLPPQATATVVPLTFSPVCSERRRRSAQRSGAIPVKLDPSAGMQLGSWPIRFHSEPFRIGRASLQQAAAGNAEIRSSNPPNALLHLEQQFLAWPWHHLERSLDYAEGRLNPFTLAYALAPPGLLSRLRSCVKRWIVRSALIVLLDGRI